MRGTWDGAAPGTNPQPRRWLRRIASPALRGLRAADHAVGRASGRRVVLVEGRTPMNLAVLKPVVEPLLDDPALRVRFTGIDREDLRQTYVELGVADRVISRERAEWSRVDLYVNADPWDAVTLRRCARQLNFFHGVAGKYDLDCPVNLPIGFERYDRVAFPNEGRLRRYVDAGIVPRDRAALVGYPKADVLANAPLPQAEAAAALGLSTARPTIVYAPTFSPASSLHANGEAIVRTLLAGGWNVIVKLHDRSFDPDPKYSGGIDWRARLAKFGAPGQFLLASGGDSTPYVMAGSLMVTDHSSIGFEFFVLDRPVVVFEVPGLADAARISPDKIALLRSASAVVGLMDDLPAAVSAELAAPERLSARRRDAVNQVFYRPGGATGRAVSLVYEMLGQPAPALRRGVADSRSVGAVAAGGDRA